MKVVTLNQLEDELNRLGERREKASNTNELISLKGSILTVKKLISMAKKSDEEMSEIQFKEKLNQFEKDLIKHIGVKCKSYDKYCGCCIIWKAWEDFRKQLAT